MYICLLKSLLLYIYIDSNNVYYGLYCCMSRIYGNIYIYVICMMYICINVYYNDLYIILIIGSSTSWR